MSRHDRHTPRTTKGQQKRRPKDRTKEPDDGSTYKGYAHGLATRPTERALQ